MICPLISCFRGRDPAKLIFFEPRKTRAAIVTCGGLCPGLNNVIRSAYLELHESDGEVWGIRYGHAGLNAGIGELPIRFTASLVDEIHEVSGIMLGKSRGPQPIDAMVNSLSTTRSRFCSASAAMARCGVLAIRQHDAIVAPIL